jgi:hypothetical protein
VRAVLRGLGGFGFGDERIVEACDVGKFYQL